jgi:GxxExxY protein
MTKIADKYTDITRKVIGLAMEVHKGLGNGFIEIIYQRTLQEELNSSGLDFAREVEMPIIYKEKNLGSRRVDFFVEGKVMIEIKAVRKLELEHLVQIKNYLESANIEIGLLLNFGSKSLEFKRIINNKLENENPLNP